MALITCLECGADVSDRAAACPKCACPLTKLEPTPNHATKACPSCAEQIAAGAKKCKFCKEYVDQPPAEPAQERTPSSGAGAATVACFVILALVVLIAISAWLALRHLYGERDAERIVNTVTKQRIVLKDSTENVRASSWAAYPLNLTYEGELEIKAQVMAGNKLDVYLLAEKDLLKLKRDGWGSRFQHYPAFEAKKTNYYARSARLKRGIYYVLFYDSTLGVLSASASDVKIRAELKP